MKKCFVVFKSDNGRYFYIEDTFNSSKTYNNKPICIFFSRKEVLKYISLKNGNDLYVSNNAYFYEHDNHSSSWAIVNGY